MLNPEIQLSKLTFFMSWPVCRLAVLPRQCEISLRPDRWKGADLRTVWDEFACTACQRTRVRARFIFLGVNICTRQSFKRGKFWLCQLRQHRSLLIRTTQSIQRRIFWELFCPLDWVRRKIFVSMKGVAVHGLDASAMIYDVCWQCKDTSREIGIARTV